MFHYEIKVDSLAYRKIYDSLEAYAKWLDDQTREKVCRLLSIKSAEGIYFSPGRLVMDSPPDHLKKQFEGPNKRGQYSARASSSLNRKWVRFCMLNNLNFIYPQDILDYEFNLVERPGEKTFLPLGARFFIKSETRLDIDFLNVVAESDFTKIRADFLAKLGETA